MVIIMMRINMKKERKKEKGESERLERERD